MVQQRKRPDTNLKARKTAVDYHRVAQKRGGQWVGEVAPLNIREKTRWMCGQCGNEFEATYERVNNGTCFCFDCAVRSENRRKLVIPEGGIM